MVCCRNGEVSRAMRNRGIELFMLSDPYQLAAQSSERQLIPGTQPTGLLQQAAPSAGQVQEPWESAVQELEAVLAAVGVPGWQGPACLAAGHLSLVQHAAQSHRYAHAMPSMQNLSL